MSEPNFIDLCRNLGTLRLASFTDKDSPNAPGRVEYPFRWGECWTANVIVNVSDLESEVGFWIDLMGFRPFAHFGESVMFRSPDNSFGMTVSRSTEETPATTNIHVELMLDNLEEAVAVLRDRGMEFESFLHPVWGDENTMRISDLVSPNGIRVTLWGMLSATETAESENVVENVGVVERS